jgi:HK97 family phage major capsid protein
MSAVVPPVGETMTKAQLEGVITEIAGKAVAELRADLDKKAATSPADLAKMMADAVRGARPKEAGEKGLGVAQVVRAMAAARGDVERALKAAKEVWGDGPATEILSHQKALSATDPGAGGVLLPPQYSEEIIELLRPMSAFRKLNPTIVPLNGTLQIPRITGGATAAYTAENADIASTEQTTGDVTLIEKELAAIVPVSNRLMRSPRADSMVRDDIVAALAQRSDLAFLRGSGTGNTPRGMRFWADSGNVTAASGGNTLTTITSGLGVLLNHLLTDNVRMIRPGWVLSGRTYVRLITVRDGNGNLAFANEMAAGTLFGYPFAFSTQIPNTFTAASAAETGGTLSEVMFADFADLVLGEGERLQLDASQEASYLDSTGTARSAFSRNQTVVRAIQFHDLVARHNESIAVLTDIDWAAA